MEKHIT
ncbi:UNVERIFIED_CONTAM: hypothetical protein GTU68_054709 [Idotea baltica]|nr:hypothetical protein [Idotea baltica]